jgi:hypothetical protein
MRLLAAAPATDRVGRGVMLAERCMTAVAQFAQRDRLDDFYDAARRDVSTRRDAAGDSTSRQSIDDLLRRIPRAR